jgi:hypothetical protein
MQKPTAMTCIASDGCVWRVAGLGSRAYGWERVYGAGYSDLPQQVTTSESVALAFGLLEKV